MSLDQKLGDNEPDKEKESIRKSVESCLDTPNLSS